VEASSRVSHSALGDLGDCSSGRTYVTGSILNAGWQEIQIGNAKPAVMESTGSRKGAPYYIT